MESFPLVAEAFRVAVVHLMAALLLLVALEIRASLRILFQALVALVVLLQVQARVRVRVSALIQVQVQVLVLVKFKRSGRRGQDYADWEPKRSRFGEMRLEISDEISDGGPKVLARRESESTTRPKDQARRKGEIVSRKRASRLCKSSGAG